MPEPAPSQGSVDKALALLDAFEDPRAVLGVSDLARSAAIPKSTAHRLLRILIGHDYVRRVGDRYSLGTHIFELGSHVRACRPNGLREHAVPFMTELYAETRETIHLAVLVGAEVLYLEKIFGHDTIPCSTAVGLRRPAYCTALGKAISAYSDDLPDIEHRRLTRYTQTTPAQAERAFVRVREEGVASDVEEYQLGVTCLAAPIFGPDAVQPVAALSISSVTSRGDVRRFTRRLTRTAGTLSAHLGALGVR